MTAQTKPPYNPWASYLVEASAGSGKTWQLSRRFLALVVAGADPGSILTVTFTKKAASEMRERIIRDAARLGQGAPEFRDFISEISRWTPSTESARPRGAQEASRLILEKTQTLKITTIDALFLQWSQRFPLETSVTINDLALTSPWNLLSNLHLTRLNTLAWGDVLAMAEDHDQNRELMASISANAPNGKIKSLADAINPLSKSETFLWYIQMLSHQGQPRDALRLFDVPDSLDDEGGFLARHEALARSVFMLMSNEEKRAKSLEHLANRDFQGLVDAKIINSSKDALNGNTFAKAKKSGDPSFVALNDELSAWSDLQKLASLNHTARLIWTLYQARTNASHRRKVNDSVGTFADASKGVSVLACDERMAGGRAMAWSSIRHLMLDEFQDTSRLQWMIFEKLSLELLSGQSFDAESGPKPSVFIVGDKKQSIYRFREAAPEVLDLARDGLSAHGLTPTTMSDSFRSSSLVLDLVNQVFADGTLMADFPRHQPSPHASSTNSDKARYGSIFVYTDSASEDDGKSSAEREALTVARHIRDCVDGKIATRVYDEHTQTWRAPRCSDFAVLYPNATHSQIFEDALREQAIPTRRAESKGFFGRPEILDLNALVTWLTWPADTVALCTVLRSPICGVRDDVLQNILRAPGGDIHFKLKDHAPEAYALLEDLRASHHKDSMAEVTGCLLTRYSAPDRYLRAFGAMEGPLARANVLKWFDLVRGASAEDALAAHTWSLAMDEASEEDETGNASLASNAVTMMTIHKSKGLEFPCVVLTGSGKDWHKPETGWIKDSRPGHEGIWYVGTNDRRPSASPQMESVLRLAEAESRGEKARLLYVALTRASHHVVVTGSSDPEDPAAFHGMIHAAVSKLSDVTVDSSTNNLLAVTRGVPPRVAPLESKTPDADEVVTTSARPLHSRPVKILTPSPGSRKKTEDQADGIPPRTPGGTPVTGQERVLPEGLGRAFGTIVHKLIENHVHQRVWSPGRLARFAAETALLAPSDPALVSLVKTAQTEVSSLMDSPVWRDLMTGARSARCEVPMAGIEGDKLLNAKADMIIERDDQSLVIVDFKTTQVTPGMELDVCVAEGYEDQVKSYCELARRSFKTKEVFGYVLFTRPAHLQPVYPR